MKAAKIGVGVVGVGLIGSELLLQIETEAARLAACGVDIAVLGLANSRKMHLASSSAGEVVPTGWKDALAGSAPAADLAAFADHVKSECAASGRHPVLVDNTASDVPPSHYLQWMDKGISVITPNKRFATGPIADYNQARKLATSTDATFFYEATVGAGLPLLSTLKTLRATGDKIVRIEGILSGTLSYIFNTVTPADNFSDVVKGAKDQGFTEPDPRDDLSGTDVQRKVTILARECGMTVELDDVPVSSLVPAALSSPDIDAAAFLERLPEFDAEFSQRIKDADARGEVLRFVGVVDPVAGKCSVELQSYPKSHPFASLQGADNIVQFQTSRYSKESPLLVRGPGAGAAVTAMGVFGDLLQVANHKGSPELWRGPE